MRGALLGLSLLLAGCAEYQGMADQIPIFYMLALPHHDDDVIEGAEEILGMEILVQELPPQTHGAIVVIRLEGQGPYTGETEILERCSPISWAVNTPMALAHEIGHSLGLVHVKARNNLMYQHTEDTHLTEAQLDRIRGNAWYLWELC